MSKSLSTTNFRALSCFGFNYTTGCILGSPFSFYLHAQQAQKNISVTNNITRVTPIEIKAFLIVKLRSIFEIGSTRLIGIKSLCADMVLSSIRMYLINIHLVSPTFQVENFYGCSKSRHACNVISASVFFVSF